MNDFYKESEDQSIMNDASKEAFDKEVECFFLEGRRESDKDGGEQWDDLCGDEKNMWRREYVETQEMLYHANRYYGVER